jgi:hypothetical protein
MKLSEAIRLGSMLKPQGDGVLFDEGGGSCALGAACDALGVERHDQSRFMVHALEVEWPMLLKAAKCPACSFIKGIIRRWREEEFDLEDVIIHLNDDHGWTRQRIADWIATMEVPAWPGPVSEAHSQPESAHSSRT